MLDQADLAFFIRLNTGLCRDRDQAATDLFQLAVEEEWRARFNALYEFYFDDPIVITREIARELEALRAAELEYARLEEYEKCLVLCRLRALFTEEYSYSDLT